ncbi:MAG: DUF4065 domain-containing protein [Candidatus Gribaldobacteria bacterium]|nr:DUF4065 domain-containing protein [Candidatus Gribaldobacteria bacterium]
MSGLNSPNFSKAIMVAEYFIKKNFEDKKGLDKLKLQKLLYYSQAWNLVINKRPLFPEKIEAWVHGPVIPEIYQAFKNFDFANPPIEILNDDFSIFKAEEKKVLDSVWESYGKYDGNYLEILTHKETPWQEARKNLSPSDVSNNIISEEQMEKYYGEKLKATQ